MQIDPKSRAGALKALLLGASIVGGNLLLWRVSGFIAPALLFLGALTTWAGLMMLLAGPGLKAMPMTQRVPIALISLLLMLGLALLGARAMGWKA
jgi:hypothetical protein